MDDPRDASPDSSAFRGYQSVKTLLIVAILGGLAAVVAYAVQAGSPAQFVSMVSMGFLLAGASATVGGLLGFLFGIPRALQSDQDLTSEQGSAAEAPDHRRRPYVGNTSLEQISDWLTKILVGVGLTQLANLPTALAALGTFAAPALGGLASAAIFAPTAGVYFTLVGFFLSYLWTRLYLPSLFAESDFRTLIGSAEQRGEEKLSKAIKKVDDARKAGGLDTDKPGSPPTRALWVDDQPENNEYPRQLLENLLRIEFDTRLSTEDGLAAITSDPERYALVLTDLGRPGDRQAGYTLLREMRQRDIQLPVIIFSVRGGPDVDREARRRGAYRATNSPSDLVEAVAEVVRERGSA